MHRIKDKKGVILIFMLLILVALIGIALAFWYMVNSDIRTMGAGFAGIKAFYIAEAGRAKARWALTKGGQTVPCQETDTAFGGGTYTFTAVYSDHPTDQHVTITSTGYIPNSTKPITQRQVVEKSISFTTGGGGGTNLSLKTNGTSAYSSGHHGNDNEDNAIDGDNGTSWVSKDKGGSSWLALDYGSAKMVSKVIVSGGYIASIVVQYSNNYINWTPVSNPSGPLPGTRTFTPVTARYLELVITSSDPKEWAQVNEFESYGGAALGQGKFATSL